MTESFRNRIANHGIPLSGIIAAAAVRIGMTHMGDKVRGRPVHMIGYSTGAPLALEFALDALDGKSAPVPGSLILISPAIGIHPAAGLASFKNWLSNLPGLDGLAYTQIQPEFDPYKYNSFATNSADVVHGLTRSVARRVEQRARTDPEIVLPIAPDDPIYGQRPPNSEEFLFLGQLGIQGERGLLTIPADWMFRLRYNPFYDYLEMRTLEWIDKANDGARKFKRTVSSHTSLMH